MGAIREVPRDRRRDADAIERSPAAAPSPLAQSVLALQHSAGNAAVQRMLALTQPAANVLARAPHRPPQGGQIKYQGAVWSVVTSSKEKPMITIQQTTGQKRQRNISWADEEFWIIRQNVGGDFDMRDEEPVEQPEAVEGEEPEDLVRTRFDEAKTKAVEMLKAYAQKHVQQSSQRALTELTLEETSTSRRPTATRTARTRPASGS